MSPDSNAKTPIVFVHGLWLHGESWNPWMEFFREKGYDAVAAKWPGDSETTEATRKNPDAIAGHGVTEIADHIAAQLKKFDRKPILIGHSFGGLLVQNLLGRDLAAAGPLLLISGANDNTVPPVLVKSTLKAYSKSPAVTELKEFVPGSAPRCRGHTRLSRGCMDEQSGTVSAAH